MSVPGNFNLNLGSGAAAEVLALTLPLAREYVLFSFAVGLLVEAFGRAPTEERHYGAVVWRLLLVVVLLANYQAVIGGVINVTAEVAVALAPAKMHARLASTIQETVDKALTARAAGGGRSWVQSQVLDTSASSTAADSVLETSASSTAAAAQQFGGMGWFFRDLVHVFSLIGLLAHTIIGRVAGVLILFSYVLGPLALAFSVPRVSGIGSKWFAGLLSFCAWPILSSVLLSLVGAVGLQMGGQAAADEVESLIRAFVFLVTALAVPKIATSLVGGGVSQALGQGAALVGGLAASGLGAAGKAGAAAAATAGAAAPAAGGAGAAPANPPGVAEGGKP
jgi:hypothetical protein